MKTVSQKRIQDPVNYFWWNFWEFTVFSLSWICFQKGDHDAAVQLNLQQYEEVSQIRLMILDLSKWWEILIVIYKDAGCNRGLFHFSTFFMRSCCRLAYFFSIFKISRGRCQTLLLILREFKRINQLLFPLKLSKNLWFSDNFREDRN